MKNQEVDKKACDKKDFNNKVHKYILVSMLLKIECDKKSEFNC